MADEHQEREREETEDLEVPEEVAEEVAGGRKAGGDPTAVEGGQKPFLKYEG